MNTDKKDSEKENKTNKIKELKEEIAKHREEKKDYLNGWKRTKADLENLKKRHRDERKENAFRTKNKILISFLEILDDFERLEKELSKNDCNSALNQGVKQIRNKFNQILKKYNVEKIKTKNQEFDPRYHEAVERVENKKHKPNIIIEEVKAGYKREDSILRPAQVKVAS